MVYEEYNENYTKKNYYDCNYMRNVRSHNFTNNDNCKEIRRPSYQRISYINDPLKDISIKQWMLPVTPGNLFIYIYLISIITSFF